MKMINEATIQFLGRSVNEGFARVVAASMVSQLDPTLEEMADIKTALSEAVTNSIVHGYAGQTGYITLTCRIYDNNLAEFIVEDKGRGIEDVSKARQPLYTTNTDLERSGMGFTVMETFMDEVTVDSALGKGTKVIMQKKIKQ